MSEESEKHSADLHFMTRTVCSKAKEHGKGNELGDSLEIAAPVVQPTSEDKVKHSTDLHFMTKTTCSKAKEHGKESGADAGPDIAVPKNRIKSEEKVKVSPGSHFMAKTACSKAREHEKANESSVVITEITVSKTPVKSEEKVRGPRDLHFMSKTACSKAKEHGKMEEPGAAVKTPASKSPVKSEDKDKSSPSLHFMSKTTCFKSKEHGKATAVPKYKPATHSGIKLKINLNKVTKVKPFTFDSPEKTTPRVRERSPGKRTITEDKVKGTEKHVRITTERKATSKESREFSSSRSSRSVSRERTANGTTKSSGTRSSGAKSPVSKKSTPKAENKPSSVTKSSSHIQKPTQSSTAKTHAKHSGDQQCPSSGTSKVASSSQTTVEFEMRKSESHSSTVEVSEKVVSNGFPMSGRHLNGEIGNRMESDLLNDAKLENLLNELNLECEIANAMTSMESVTTKNLSKIPRKRGSPQSDNKVSSTDNQKKSTNIQPHSFDSGIIANGKKETMVMVSEMNAVQITNVN